MPVDNGFAVIFPVGAKFDGGDLKTIVSQNFVRNEPIAEMPPAICPKNEPSEVWVAPQSVQSARGPFN